MNDQKEQEEAAKFTAAPEQTTAQEQVPPKPPTTAEIIEQVQREIDFLRATMVGRERVLKEWLHKAEMEMRAAEKQEAGNLVAFLKAAWRWWLRVTTVQLWFCGFAPAGGDMEVIGVFSSHRRAAHQCLDRRFFIAPIGLNRPFPTETVNWPGLEVPNVNPGPEVEQPAAPDK